MMHFINDYLVSPWLERNGFWKVRFRVAIDFGETTIAKLGIHGTNAFVAIGSTPNIANRLLRVVSEGVAIGNNVFRHLPPGWALRSRALPDSTGYVYKVSGQPYRAWELTHRMLGWPIL
jgi:class 3 adenylate cyclase